MGRDKAIDPGFLCPFCNDESSSGRLQVVATGVWKGKEGRTYWGEETRLGAKWPQDTSSLGPGEAHLFAFLLTVGNHLQGHTHQIEIAVIFTPL